MTKSLTIILTVFIAALVGIILIGIIADNTVTKTQLKTYSETVNIAAARTDEGRIVPTVKFMSPNWTGSGFYSADRSWKKGINDCLIGADIGGWGIKNQSGAYLTETTDYAIVDETATTRGYFTLVNTDAVNGTGNSTTIVYKGCPNDYLQDSWARVAINLVPGFFALALFVGVAFVIFFILKEEGIADVG